MIQLDSIQYKKNGTYGFKHDGHREPKYLVKFVICGIHSVILVLLYSVCERVCVCVCLNLTKMKKYNFIDKILSYKIKERNLSLSFFCGSFDRVNECFLLFDCDFHWCCFVYMRIVHLKYR